MKRLKKKKTKIKIKKVNACILSKVTPKPGSALYNTNERVGRPKICTRCLVCVRNIILARANCQERHIRRRVFFTLLFSTALPVRLSLFTYFSDGFRNETPGRF